MYVYSIKKWTSTLHTNLSNFSGLPLGQARRRMRSGKCTKKVSTINHTQETKMLVCFFNLGGTTRVFLGQMSKLYV